MKNANILLVYVFMAAVLLPFALGLTFPDWAKTGNENHALAEFPDIRETGATGWTQGFDAWLKDHLPFKDLATRQYSGTMLKIFKASINEHVVVGKNGWYLFNGYPNDNPLVDLSGLNAFSEDEQTSILGHIDAYESAHPGVPFVLYVAPNKESVYRELFPDSYAGSFVDQTRVEKLALYPDGENKLCYNLDELRRWKKDYQLYYKYDTHWNQVGAYIGLRSICQRLSIQLPELEKDMIIPSDVPVRRDLVYLSNTLEYCTDDTEVDVFPYKNINVIAGEAEYLFDESLAYIRRFSSNAPNRQTLILIGDSFSEVMIDVAARCFTDVIFVRRDTGRIEEMHALLEQLIAENKDCVVAMEIVERGAWWLIQNDLLF